MKRIASILMHFVAISGTAFSLQSFAYSQVDPFAPAPSDEVVAAWRKARALYTAVGDVPNWKDFPCFELTEKFSTEMLKDLPEPAVPFGLRFHLQAAKEGALKECARFNNLQYLNLEHTAGIALREMALLPQLRVLRLDWAQLGDEEMRSVGALKQLKKLGLLGTKITDHHLQELAGLNQLEHLNLGSNRITDAGLKALVGLKQVQFLDLSGNQITGSGLKNLAELKGLRTLDLTFTPMTDAHLRELVQLKQVTLLSLRNMPFLTDAGLMELASLPQLTGVLVSGPKITPDGIEQLKKIHPATAMQ